MLDVQCDCGAEISLPEEFVGEAADCPDCRTPMRLVSAGPRAEECTGRLRIVAAEGNHSSQFLLCGDGPFDIGKQPDMAIVLPGALVSRRHCRLVRAGGQWRIIDQSSTNGLFVNGHRVTTHDLQPGDQIDIGEFQLAFSAAAASPPEPTPQRIIEEGDAPEDLYALADPGPAPRPISSYVTPPRKIDTTPLTPAVPCPSCRKMLPAGAKICVECGVDAHTGRALLTARQIDEDALYVHTETVVRGISFLIPFGLYPVASEGYGSKKPHAIWAIAGITIFASILFWAVNASSPTGLGSSRDLMLWAGRTPTADDIVARYEIGRHSDEDMIDDVPMSPKEKAAFKQAIVAEYQKLPPERRLFGEFHWYQLLTHALLHGGIMHLVGNLLFLLVFGSRVNALIGPLRTAILYPVLAVVAAVSYMIAQSKGSPVPMIGASGAIMGLAGMYFVLFPVHRVHMVIWLRLGLFTGYRLMFKIFALRGFWVVLFYLAFDVAATLLGSRDNVAHWAHLGGFIGGAVLASVLLIARQLDARGGDLFTAMLGKHAWALLGRPSERMRKSAGAVAA